MWNDQRRLYATAPGPFVDVHSRAAASAFVFERSCFSKPFAIVGLFCVCVVHVPQPSTNQPVKIYIYTSTYVHVFTHITHERPRLSVHCETDKPIRSIIYIVRFCLAVCAVSLIISPVLQQYCARGGFAQFLICEIANTPPRLVLCTHARTHAHNARSRNRSRRHDTHSHANNRMYNNIYIYTIYTRIAL